MPTEGWSQPVLSSKKKRPAGCSRPFPNPEPRTPSLVHDLPRLRRHQLEDLGRQREREAHGFALTRHLERVDERGEHWIVLALKLGERDDAVQHAAEVL